jgi:NADPH-dependent curcumin reductase CurA
MQAIRVHQFGGLDALVAEDVPRPVPGDGEVLLRVMAAGVGPWDGWIRSGRSVLPQPLPLTLGSDVAGLVEQVGPAVQTFRVGDAVFGATNARFTGGYAEYAVASASITLLARMKGTPVRRARGRCHMKGTRRFRQRRRGGGGGRRERSLPPYVTRAGSQQQAITFLPVSGGATR